MATTKAIAAALDAPDAATADAVLAALGSDRRNGLPEGEARRRLDHDGPNVVPEQPPVPVIVLLARQFIDSMVLLLLGAAAISFAIGEGLDGAIILAIVVLNGVFGAVQEGRAQQAARAVRALLEQRTVVVRGGRPREIETAWVVLGDVVVLGSGDRVPADGRIVAAAGVEIDESVLTGRRCRASSGRIHRRSRAQGSVTVPRWPTREPWCPGAVPGSSSPPLGRGRRWRRSPSWPGRNDR